MEAILMDVMLPVVIASVLGWRRRRDVAQAWRNRRLLHPSIYWSVALFYVLCGASVTFPIVSAHATGLDLLFSTLQVISVFGLLSPAVVYLLARHLAAPTFETNDIPPDQREFFHGCWMAFWVPGLVMGMLPGLLTSARLDRMASMHFSMLVFCGCVVVSLITYWRDRQEIAQAWRNRSLFHPVIYWGLPLLYLISGQMLVFPWFAPVMFDARPSSTLTIIQSVSFAGLLSWGCVFLLSVWIAKPVFTNNGIAARSRSYFHLIWMMFFFVGAALGTWPAWL